jgi:hypothetical protein
LDKGSSNPLALEADLSSRMSGEQVQLLHLNRALLYYLSGEPLFLEVVGGGDGRMRLMGCAGRPRALPWGEGGCKMQLPSPKHPA